MDASDAWGNEFAQQFNPALGNATPVVATTTAAPSGIMATIKARPVMALGIAGLVYYFVFKK